MINTTSLVYPISGLLVGVLVGLTGVGGGSLMTPLLLAFGVHANTAVGTDLLYAATTKSVGTLVHNASETVDWKIVRRLALGSVPTTALTLLALSALGAQSKGVTHAISFVLGIALLLTAIAIFMRRALVDWISQRYGDPSEKTAQTLTIVSGAVLGVLVSLSSVGAGALGVTVLILLYPGVKLVKIVGSDIAHAVPLTLIAGADRGQRYQHAEHRPAADGVDPRHPDRQLPRAASARNGVAAGPRLRVVAGRRQAGLLASRASRAGQAGSW
jgi:uncharacterized membrane protein YfcA